LSMPHAISNGHVTPYCSSEHTWPILSWPYMASVRPLASKEPSVRPWGCPANPVPSRATPGWDGRLIARPDGQELSQTASDRLLGAIAATAGLRIIGVTVIAFP